MKPYFSVVIPIFNEEENLPELIERTYVVCHNFCEKNKTSFELIIIDDGSTDNSSEILREAAIGIPEMIVLFFKQNCGQHAAVYAGMKRSLGDIVITLDGDLQNPPEEIPKLLKAIEGVDIVGTIRHNRQDSFFRKIVSLCANSVTNAILKRSTGIMMHDYGCMLRAYRRSVVEKIVQYKKRSTFIPVLANSFAEKACEIEVCHSERRYGESKYDIWQLLVLQWNLLRSLPEFPLRFYLRKIMIFFGGVVVILTFLNIAKLL